MEDLSRYREQFPILKKTMHGKPLIYFDSAATAQKPYTMIEAIDRFYREEYGTVHRAVYELSVLATEKYQRCREQVAQFIHAAHPHEVIFTRGTTESINMIAYSFGKAFVRPGDEILITEMEHHSNIVPWQILCEDRQAVLKVAPMDENGELIMEQFVRLLSEKTRLVAVAHIANSIGTLNPIKKIAEVVHQAGAKLLVDGAQSAPHLPIDVQDLGADFYLFSGHKVYGPTGIGVLYGKESLLDAMPPCQGGGDMIQSVTFEKTSYNVLPMKFEAGTPMIAEVVGLGAALEFLVSIGIPQIKEWEEALLEHATTLLQTVPRLSIIGPKKNKGAIISFVVEGVHPLDIGTMLDLRGIAIRTGHHCAQPTMRHFNLSATARLSFGLYNSKHEVEKFVTFLAEIIQMLR